jgi:tripartite-type tricarboxylate transporter receptor subunit TctC
MKSHRWWWCLMLRTVLGTALSAAALGCGLAHAAEDQPARLYPSRTVRILTGNQPGIASDVIARLVGEKLEQVWGQSVLIENLPGAGGTIAAEAVARAPADGHVLFMGSHSALALAKAVGKAQRYDPLRDLAPIGRVAQIPAVLVASRHVPVHSVPDLIAFAKAHPGRLTYVTHGPGTLSQLGVEMFAMSTGTTMLAVPYKGLASGLVDLIAGRVDLALLDFVSAAPHVASGELQALGVAGTRRLPDMPNVPTIAEQGVAGYAVSGWYGLLAPSGTPPEIVAKLAVSLDKVRRMPEVRRRLEQMQSESVDDTPAQFQAFITAETEKYTEIARRVGADAQ